MKPPVLPTFALLSTVIAGAADKPASTAAPGGDPGPVRETPRNYTDNTSTFRVETNIPPFYDHSSGYWTGRQPPLFHNHSSTVTVRHRMIFLPPAPPALGEPIPAANPSPTLTKTVLPPSLRSCLYETFYAPLSALMYSEDLTRKRRDSFDAYQAGRLAALTALRARIDALAGADPDTRQRDLAAFAAQQAPQLAGLEADADAIRTNLVAGSFFASGVDWDNFRTWRLGDDTRWESQFDEIKVLAGSSFFEDGLSTPQRHLLRELALELGDGLGSPGADLSLGTPGPFLYFSPFTARIRLPAGLPAELETKIASYRERKAALKRELRDVFYRTDRAFWSSTRTNALRTLAAKQAPEFAALEQLAEEIRLGLAPFPNPARPAVVPLPAAVQKRVSAYIAQKTAWQKAMVDKLNSLRTRFPDDRVEFSRLGGTPSVQLVPSRRHKVAQAAARDMALADLVVFNSGQQKGYDALAREKERLAAEILQIASTLAGRQPAKTIDQLLLEFDFSLRQQENWLRYADYETAVLQPGLSPEQRRLLFGAALEKLDLPLLNP